MATAPRTTIDSLQAGRGLAAMAVVCHHADLYVGQQVGPLPTLLSRVMSFGYLGVDFFFVLSGFIIFFTNKYRVGRPGWPRAYAESRITRIYLPYLPIGIAIAIAYTLFPGVSRGITPWGWFSTLTLLPGTREPALHVAWTLQHEVIFYALAFLFLWSGRVLAGSLLWAAAILLLLPMHFTMTPAVSPIDVEFLFGIATAWCFLERKMLRHWPLLVIGPVLAIGFLVIADRDWSVLFGLGLACLLLPVVRLETSGRFAVARFWVLLGDASYAIYLIHLPLMSAIVRLFHAVDPILAAALAVLVSAAAGIFYHLVFEKPALRLVRRWLRAWDARNSPEPA